MARAPPAAAFSVTSFGLVNYPNGEYVCGHKEFDYGLARGHRRLNTLHPRVTIMARVLITSLVVFLSTGLLFQPASAETSTAHFASHGDFAEAVFSSTDSTGCIESEVVIAVTDVLFKDSTVAPFPFSDRRAFIRLEQLDNCNGEVLVAGSGTTFLERDQFEARRGEVATLNATLSFLDAISGTVVSVDASLSWQATGEIVSFKEQVLFRTPDSALMTRINCVGSCGDSDSAITGAVTDGTTNFTPNTGVGFLSHATEGGVFIQFS
jgi:hypothetical protein